MTESEGEVRGSEGRPTVSRPPSSGLQSGVRGPELASPATIDIRSVELIVREVGKGPTSSSLLCPLFGDALGLPHRCCGVISISQAQGNGKCLSAATTRCLPHSRSDRSTSPSDQLRLPISDALQYAGPLHV